MSISGLDCTEAFLEFNRGWALETGSFACQCAADGTLEYTLTASSGVHRDSAVGTVDCLGGAALPFGALVADYADQTTLLDEDGDATPGPELPGTWTVAAGCADNLTLCGYDGTNAPACRNSNDGGLSFDEFGSFTEEVWGLACGTDGVLIATQQAVQLVTGDGAGPVLDPAGAIHAIGHTQHHGCFVSSGSPNSYQLHHSPGCDDNWETADVSVLLEDWADSPDLLLAIDWDSGSVQQNGATWDAWEVAADAPAGTQSMLPFPGGIAAITGLGVHVAGNDGAWAELADAPINCEPRWSPTTEQFYCLGANGVSMGAGLDGLAEVLSGSFATMAGL